MPVYEYQCKKCGYTFEIRQNIKDSPLKTCEKCHKDSLEKLISATSFQLKGEGWYATDYKSQKDKSTAAPKVDTPVETKTETKTETTHKTSDS